jgi:putative inorganic carbon (HCO3(-)) transporter
MSGIVADRAARGRRPWRLMPSPAFAGFLVYVFVIMTQRLPLGTLAMVAALGGLLLQRDVFRMPRFLWLFAAWIVWAALGYTVTRYPDVVFETLIERGKLVLVAFVAVNVLRTDAQIRYFMVFVLVGYLLFPARSTLVNYATGNVLGGRAIGPFMYANPNDLAAVTILMLGPALALWASSARGSLIRWAALAGAAPLIVIVVLTQSRGAFLALIAIALPSAVALARRRPRTVIALGALVALALYFAPAAFWTRMQGLEKATSVTTIGEMDPEGSARQRFAVLQTATRIVRDHPVLGIGLGAYGLANAQYTPSLGNLDTHNTYLNILAETGAPGLIFFLALVISVLGTARVARRRAQRALPAQAEMLRWLQFGLIGFLIAGVFGSLSNLPLLYVYLALLWSASGTPRAGLPASPSQPPPRQPDRMATPVDRFHGLGGSHPRS